MTPPSLRRAAALLAMLAVPAAALAQAAVEGRVELPKGLHAPVMNKRYGIVAFGGVLSPFPPVAVVIDLDRVRSGDRADGAEGPHVPPMAPAGPGRHEGRVP